MLRVEGLTCRYGKITAISELSLEVHKSELVTLIGANGAGKTTTLRAISGLVAPATVGGGNACSARERLDRWNGQPLTTREAIKQETPGPAR